MTSSKASNYEVELVFLRAIEADWPINIRINCGSHGAAMSLRARLNKWRQWDRETSVQMYKVGHPLYGVSIYDGISMRVPGVNAPDSHFIYVTRRKTLAIVGEVLSPEGVWVSMDTGLPVEHGPPPIPEEATTLLLHERPGTRPLAIDDIAFDPPKAKA